MQKTFYVLTWIACGLICEIGCATKMFALGDPAIRSVSSAEDDGVYTPHFVKIAPQDALTTPDENTEYPVEQNNIKLDIHNSNGRGVTEVYRSRSSSSGFELVGTIPHDEYRFEDPGLNVRTTYYYKWRAVDGTAASPFSAPYALTTLSINYWPTLSAELINANTIRLTLTDNSMNDERYFIDLVTSAAPGFNQEVSMPDSGRTVTFDHTGVQPGETYGYSAWVITAGDEEPTFFDVARAEVQVPGSATCAGTGKIEREIWSNLPGTDIRSIPVNQPPTQTTELTSFSTPNYTGNEYGSRIRGYVCPPTDGTYTFWIASDDGSELYLSTDDNPANKRKIASVTGYTNIGQWTKYPTQQSAPIQLEAGRLYYIEALHKEDRGADHVAVGWQLPDGTMQRPIPGTRLVKFNHAPVVELTTPEDGQTFTTATTIGLNATATDRENKLQWVDFERNGSILFRDTSAPYGYAWTNPPAGEHKLTAVAYDGQYWTVSDTVTITVTTDAACSGTGSIRQEFWTNIPGTDINSVDFSSPPNTSKVYTSFETQQYWGNEYGSRMRAYLCPPTTGLYTFWISSDDNSRLYLVTDGNMSNKKLIASVTGATQFRQYDKYPSQKSAQIMLEAGRTYYIEALHKEGLGNDFISVGWQLPNGALERPINGTRLIPFGVVTNQRPTVKITSPSDNATFPSGSDVVFTATASDTDGQVIKVEFEALYSNQTIKIGEDLTAPYQVTWNDAPDGNYTIVARATDNSGVPSSHSIIHITIGGGFACEGAGTIYQELWYNIPGTSVSAVPFDSEPDQVRALSMFGTPSRTANEYGSRIRAYLCVPISGEFRFYLSSDDNSELWLSTDEDPANKVKIAYLNRAVDPNSWSQYAGQSSAAINLVGGRKYYIEVLHKEGAGDDFVAVGWRFQNGDFEGPIPGNRLLPYDPSSSMAARIGTSAELKGSTSFDQEMKNELSLYPNPAVKKEVLIGIPNTSAGMAKLQLISSSGKVIIEKEFPTEEQATNYLLQLDASTTTGVYMVNVLTGKTRYSRRLVVN
jgi:hypothetical protein